MTHPHLWIDAVKHHMIPHSRIIEFFYRLYPNSNSRWTNWYYAGLVIGKSFDSAISTVRKILQFHHWPFWHHCIRWILQSIVYTLHQSRFSHMFPFLCHRLPLPSIPHQYPRILLRDVWSEKDGIDKIYLHLLSSPEPKTTSYILA